MYILEVTLFLAIASAICLTARRYGLPGRRVAVVLGVYVIAAAALHRPNLVDPAKPTYFSEVSGEQPAELFLPRVDDTEFVSSDACRSCHSDYYSSWHDSYHRTMTQVANRDTVAAPFNSVLSSRGVTATISNDGDDFWAIVADPDREVALQNQGIDLFNPEVQKSIPKVKCRIVQTTGSHSFQAYWLVGAKGYELLQFPFVYHIPENRWLLSEHAFLRPPGASRRVAMWNTSCINCHTVGGRPSILGPPNANRPLMSVVGERGISCESCHGPGREHVKKHRSPVSRYLARADDQPDETIVNPADLSPKLASHVCAQCHSSHDARVDDYFLKGKPYRAGDDLESMYHLFGFEDPVAEAIDKTVSRSAWWNDGTSRVGGREYMGMIDSACYQDGHQKQGMSCLSCHSMHASDPNDQLARGMDGNKACLQCHSEFTDRIEEHTHHAAGTPGSRCYDCHMPHTSYALLRAIRSHRIQSPRVRSDWQVKTQPNGCNQCHQDRSLSWTAEKLHEWYGQPRPDLDSKGDQANIATMLVWVLSGDAAQRAIAASVMGHATAHETVGSDWQAPFLANRFHDPYVAVRYIAWMSLRKLNGFEDFEFSWDGSDEVREEARLDVIRRWREQGGSKSKHRAELLLKDDGGIDVEAVNRLLDRRDKTPIIFPE